MNPRPYASAFSFPGEHRDYVERVARALLAEPQRAELAGADRLQVLVTTRLAPADLRGARG